MSLGLFVGFIVGFIIAAMLTDIFLGLIVGLVVSIMLWVVLDNVGCLSDNENDEEKDIVKFGPDNIHIEGVDYIELNLNTKEIYVEMVEFLESDRAYKPIEYCKIYEIGLKRTIYDKDGTRYYIYPGLSRDIVLVNDKKNNWYAFDREVNIDKE